MWFVSGLEFARNLPLLYTKAGRLTSCQKQKAAALVNRAAAFCVESGANGGFAPLLNDAAGGCLPVYLPVRRCFCADGICLGHRREDFNDFVLGKRFAIPFLPGSQHYIERSDEVWFCR